MDILANAEKNPRGIPKAPFVEDCEKFVGGPDSDAEVALTKFNDALAKYKFMESNLTTRRAGLEQKLPDIAKTLQMVKFLNDRRKQRQQHDEDEDDSDPLLTTTFELNDTLYAEARLNQDIDSVYLWLGANVMLSYPIDEAVELLSTKLASAEVNLANIIQDMEFIREQITVMEVNTARVYNWDVKRRRSRGNQS